MGDGAEGLVDAEARIQERMEERAAQSRTRPGRPVKDPERARRLESFRLARTALERQLETTRHEIRREQLLQAIAEIDRRVAEENAAA
jgi:hypothetical protein